MFRERHARTIMAVDDAGKFTKYLFLCKEDPHPNGKTGSHFGVMNC